MTLEILALGSLALAAIPAVTFLRNLRVYRGLPAARAEGPVSVLIPARNEAENIGPAVRSVLRSDGVDLEVVVLDDDSTDGTARVVEELAAADERVRLVRGGGLPAGWCGKQHACALLARHACHDLLLFLDADVRLERGGLQRVVAALEGGSADLLSGFPRQVVVGRLERWLLPLIHFVLLGFLPMWRMRRSSSPAYGAGCGQLMAVKRGPYEAAGGHAAVRSSLHDGLKLPRALRRAGFMTDLFDATEIASCRMYRSAEEVWKGLGKNAHEGLASGPTLIPATLMLVWGQILPLPLLIAAVALGDAWMSLASAAALGLTMLPRAIAMLRFQQPWDGTVVHPLAMVLLLTIQWQAFVRRLRGRPTSWRDRSYRATESVGDHA